MSPDQTKSLDRFPPTLLADPDTAGWERHPHLEFLEALTASFTGVGIEKTIATLNRLGHALQPVPDASPGWRIFREPLPDGEHDLNVSCREDGSDLAVSTPVSEAAWARRIAARQEDMTPEERIAQDVEEAFSARGSELFTQRYEEWESLDHADRAIMAVYVLDAEVSNGGFAQYYTNTGGHQAEAVVAILEAIGAPNASALVRASMTAVGGPFGLELTEAQWKALDQHEEQLDGLDDRFYDLDEDLAALTMAWVESQSAGT